MAAEVGRSMLSSLELLGGDLDHEDAEAFSYYLHVAKGLLCRSLVSAEPLPPEAAAITKVSELQRWGEFRRSSHRLWTDFIRRQRRSLGQEPVTTLSAKSRLVAVMIEMREHEDLDVVLRQTLSQLEEGRWAFLLVHGRRNKDFVQRVTQGWQHVKLCGLSVDDLDSQAYANFRRSEQLLALLEDLGAEVAFFFECDSVLLRPGVESFLDFDLVGAPWSWALLQGLPAVGNGGLSLRRSDFLRRAVETMKASPSGEVELPWECRNEDICFARAGVANGATLPSANVAAKFSVETIFHPSPIGCHKPWQYLLPSDMYRLLGLWEPVD